MISKRLFVYHRLGWPALLPEFWAVYGIMFRNVRQEHGLMTVVFLLLDLLFKWRTEMAKEFRRRLLRDLLLIGFGIWTFIQARPWIKPIWNAATDGIALQWPKLPFSLPAVSMNDLPGAFLHYGWLLPVVAFLAYRRLAGVVIILSWAVLLSFLGASLACGYAAVIGDSWTDQTTTNNYFSFGPALPVVMPMHTFMQDWGIVLCFWMIYSVGSYFTTKHETQQQKVAEAQKPSGALPDCREATTADLRNGGLL